MGETFAGIVDNGPLFGAVAVAAVAGLLSFLSPCVLPLLPGYLSYVTGLAGADLDAGHRRGRITAGVLLFIAGVGVVFILGAILASQAGSTLHRHQRAIEIGVGLLITVLGLVFAGFVPPVLQREWRIQTLPAAGLIGAPVFGVVFALSWIPCTGPTLGAMILLASTGSTARAIVLAVAYCLGMALPFLAFGLGYRRLLGVFRAVRRNSRWVTRIGGALLILTGLALVTGVWGHFIDWLRVSFPSGEFFV
jgi:cytochrome c-type biogenesis protein